MAPKLIYTKDISEQLSHKSNTLFGSESTSSTSYQHQHSISSEAILTKNHPILDIPLPSSLEGQPLIQPLLHQPSTRITLIDTPTIKQWEDSLAQSGSVMNIEGRRTETSIPHILAMITIPYPGTSSIPNFDITKVTDFLYCFEEIGMMTQ